MNKTRLQNTPEDYKQLGLSTNEVELWEDGKRTDETTGDYEWWYFDAVMDDGSSISLNFATKSAATMSSPKLAPTVTVNITSKDGTRYKDVITYAGEEASISKEQCDFLVGPHAISGDLKEYTVKITPINGLGCDLKLRSRCKPWRPATGHFDLGGAGKYFTWLFVVPQGDISGTMTYEGKTFQVKGEGYHDHQWGNMSLFTDVNHWLWGRQILGGYTVLMFDLVTGAATDYERYPFFCVQDLEGNVVLDNMTCDDGFRCEIVEEYFDKDINKSFPRKIKYTYGHDGKTANYELSTGDAIYVNDHYNQSPEAMRKGLDSMGLAPVYIRYTASGSLELNTEAKSIQETGDMIYEFAYFTTHYADVMDTKKI